MKKETVADKMFLSIGTGRHNAISRPGDERADRALRKKIQLAQNNGELIINTGNGYYRPDLSDPVEAMDFEAYLSAKKSRIRAQAVSVAAMERTARKILADLEKGETK